VTRAAEGPGAVIGFSFLNSRRMISAGEQLWLATEQGVFRVDPSTFRGRQWDVPDATCLAATARGVWVGTLRGLSFISGDESAQDFGASALSITSLLAVGETLWVGTNAGLGQVLPGATGVTTPLELADRPTLRVTVYALGRLQDTLVMATERDLLWRDPTTRAWTAIPLPLSLGIPTALAAYHGDLWIGGTRGLAQADVRDALIHTYSMPYDVPAPVRDLSAGPDFLWAATDSGLMRIQ
jgi:ligand-binding sensor domain-containing protein